MDEIPLKKIENYMKNLYNGNSKEDARSLANKACDEFGLWNDNLTIPDEIYELAYDVTEEQTK
jgi:hypothetical protein